MLHKFQSHLLHLINTRIPTVATLTRTLSRVHYKQASEADSISFSRIPYHFRLFLTIFSKIINFIVDNFSFIQVLTTLMSMMKQKFFSFMATILNVNKLTYILFCFFIFISSSSHSLTHQSKIFASSYLP